MQKFSLLTKMDSADVRADLAMLTYPSQPVILFCCARSTKDDHERVMHNLMKETLATHLTNRTKHHNKTLDHFWKRWRLEYLLELRDYHRYRQGT